MIGVGPRYEFLGTAGGGAGALAPFEGTAIANDTIQWLEYRPWRAQNAGEEWSMQKAADDTFALRFEVRQGDLASGGARSELSGHPFLVTPEKLHKFEGAFLIEPGETPSSWALIHQIHHDDASLGDSPPFTIELETDIVTVNVRNNAGTLTPLVASDTPIVRGRWYYLSYGVLIPGSTGTGAVDLYIADDEGNAFITVSASGLDIGYDDARWNYVKLGIYMDDQPETLAARWRNVSVAYADATAIGSNATDPARALPAPFFAGLAAPTWCWSSAFQCLASFTDPPYEHETSPLRVDFIYDQSGNGWSLSQGTDLTRPLDSRSNYLFAPYFEGGGDLMGVNVSNDTSDLLDTTGFYIVAIVHTIGVPANNDAVDSGTVNNNPLIFGENSGARNFGVVTRDNGSGTGPWDAQFFVKDAGGEKATHVVDSLITGEPNLIECEHNGTEITMRVNGGAWSTPVTCGAMVATTGFPRIGHCGTSYQGDIIAIATWKTVPSLADKAAIASRFAAIKTLLGF